MSELPPMSDVPELPTPEPDPVPEEDSPVASTARATTLAPEGPHGGASISITDGHGNLEWIAETGRVYFLDPVGGPLRQVANVRVILSTASGPRATRLVPCSAGSAADACYVCPQDTLRGQLDVARLVRFELGGQRYHVRIPRRSAATQPES